MCVGSASCAGEPCGHDGSTQGEREGEGGWSLREEGERASHEDACGRTEGISAVRGRQ